MKQIKILIICLLIIMLILAMILSILIKGQTKKGEVIDSNNTIISSELYDYAEQKTAIVTDETVFYTVAKCVSEYFDKLNISDAGFYIRGENEKIIDNVMTAQMIINLLDQQYIENHQITTDNVYQFVEKVTQKEIFIPLKMNFLPQKNAEKYAVYGYTENTNHQLIREIYIIVTLDVKNSTFSIEPLLNQSYQDINEIELLNDNQEIQKNENNQFRYEKVNNGYTSNQYLTTMKKMLLSNSKLMYNYLDVNYKNARFHTYEEFQEWIDTNKERINQIALQEYSVKIIDNGTQYICIDQNNHYYIFQETVPMQYTVMLDTYTIDLPEFITKYEKATSEEKVLMNIQKFFMAIDNSDYRYAYSKLDETFRANNFATLQEFEQYCKTIFFENNKLAASGAQKQNDVYLYTITISDRSGSNAENIRKTFVMQLKQGTDFVMSFSK